MADERGAIILGDRVEARLDRFEQRFDSLEQSVAELKGEVRQMDKRVENIERVITQIQWSLVSGFLVTILAVILTRLLR